MPESTTCCVVRGGPAGVVLSYLLARQEVDVTLLESHKDFDRAFRGDTLHASVLDCLQQLGLAEDVLKLAGSRVREVKFVTDSSELVVAEFSRLKTEIPFIAMIPQVKFLGFMVG
ncbi:MAG TPA: FAD-dependent oxidoreductase, partial [Verrucomicrobiales bacterium]|nr:FAD-dependent oxidoreductase [Verrucomicrobiales bacterium]